MALFGAAVAWIRTNPMPAYFDEAIYAESAIFDDWHARHRGAGGVAESLLKLDPLRPPMHRVLALPVSIATRADLTALRIYSLAVFLLAALLMADAVRSVAGATAAATAFLLLLAAPVLVFSTRIFGTEYPLLLAVALLVWSLFRRQPVALAVAVGVGLLSKVSFLFAAVPLLALAFGGASRWPFLPSRRALAVSCLAGLAIALVWWLHDPMPPLRYAFAPAAFIRHRLGPIASPMTLPRFAVEMLRTGTGFALAAVLVSAMVLVRRRALVARREAFLVLAAAGAVLAPILTYTSGSHNPRYLAPALLLVLPAAAVALSAVPRALAAAALVAAVQVALMAMPRQWTEADARRSFIRRGVLEMMAPTEQWDWTALRALTDRLGVARPVIATLGEGYAFNGPQIRYAWQRVHRDVRVLPLYRWDADPPFDLRRAVEQAARAQIVVTVPGYRGEATDGQVPNNEHNARFAAALARDPRFAGPVAVDVGVRESVPVAVFIRRQ